MNDHIIRVFSKNDKIHSSVFVILFLDTIIFVNLIILLYM